MGSGPTNQEKTSAVEFLQGDMWPFSDVLDLPADGAALQDYLKTIRTGDFFEEEPFPAS